MATAGTVDTDFAPPPSSGKGETKKLGDRIQCVVVTPERTLFDDVVDAVVLPLFDGELGVLPGRSPLIGRLGFGELRTTTQGSTHRYFIDGGFAQVRDDVVTILTSRAIPAALVDPEVANKELAQALARTATNLVESDEKTRAVDRARAQIRVARARG
jgi:F-type H+-transporting ATPase subunit epsilon